MRKTSRLHSVSPKSSKSKKNISEPTDIEDFGAMKSTTVRKYLDEMGSSNA